MKLRRETQLIIVLAAVLFLWPGIRFAKGVLFDPIDERRAQIKRLKNDIELQSHMQLEIARSRQQLKRWKLQSLPPDLLDAQRMYREWLTDLAQMAGFSELTIAPARNLGSRAEFTPVRISVEATATFEQLCVFLYRFYRTDLLHRIADLNVTTSDHEGNPTMTVKLIAEGLSMEASAERDRLFAQTELNDELSPTATEIAVGELHDFPEQTDFRIRVGSEFLTVKKIDGQRWTIVRGVDESTSASHPAKSTVELAPVNPLMKDRSYVNLRTVIDNNPFVKRLPENASLPQVADIGEKSMYLGQTLEFAVEATVAETLRDKLRFRLDEKKPEGAEIDAEKGLFRYQPADSAKPGDTECTIVVFIEGSPELSVKKTFKVSVKDDAATQTELTASIANGEQWQAWLRDRSSKKLTVLQVGSKVEVSDIVGEVLAIEREFVLLRIDGVTWKLELGKSLRSLKELSTPNEADPKSSDSEPDST